MSQGLGSTPPSLPRVFPWDVPATRHLAGLCPAPSPWLAGSQAVDTSPLSPASSCSALQLLTVLKFGFSSAGPVSYAFFFSLFVSVSVSVSLSFPSPPPPLGPPPFTLAGGLPTPGREGRMVVLSLVLGLSEQDDFANIPDLQNPGTQQNQNAQGDKRYEHRRGPAAAAAEKEAWRGHQPRPPVAGRGGGAFSGCWSGRTAPSPAGALTRATLGVSLRSEARVAVLGPFWIKPAPRACLPSPGASQPFCPIFPLGSPLLHPHLSSLPHPDPEIPVSPVVGGRRGC